MSDSQPLPTADEASISSDDEPGVNVAGLLAIVALYLVVLAVGVYAGWKRRRVAKQMGLSVADQEEMMLAGRGLGLVVGVLTTGATWVGGGFINGSAEVAFAYGLVWVQAPIGFSLALVVSGVFFAKKMRESKYVTMIDPFTQKYGKWGSLQAIIAAFADVLWSAAILGALGSTLQVILSLERTVSIIVSAVIAILYTLIGGLISVAYTDIVQLFFMVVGLFLALPFAFTNENVGSIKFSETDWRGKVEPQHMWDYIDIWPLLILGGVPWQAYFQRALSAKTATRAQMNAFGGCLIALFMAVPPVLFGGIAQATDWNATAFGRQPTSDESSLILPLCLQYLTPTPVAVFGLAAVSAAVMSSTDSSMLSAASMLARNVYKTVFRPKASDFEVLIALWVLILINATSATALAISYTSIYGLFVLCADLVYVVLFPQFVLVLFYDKSNTYGSVFAYFVGLIIRLLCGEATLDFPPVLPVNQVPCGAEALADDPACAPGPVPFRTIVMILSLLMHAGVSAVTHWAFTSGKIDLRHDFFQCYKQDHRGMVVSKSSRHLDTGDEITLESLKTRLSIPRPKSVKSPNGDGDADRGYDNRAVAKHDEEPPPSYGALQKDRMQ